MAGNCHACRHDHDGQHGPSHDRYNEIVEIIGIDLETNIASQVIDALKTQSEEAYQDMLRVMQSMPFAFLQMLNINMK